MNKSNYVVCDGLQVPFNWTVDALRKALAKRNITFPRDGDAIVVFADALSIRQALERDIARLREEKAALERSLKDSAKKAEKDGTHNVKVPDRR
jgi:hypothetical protein